LDFGLVYLPSYIQIHLHFVIFTYSQFVASRSIAIKTLIYYLCRNSTYFTVLQMQFAKLFHSSFCSCVINYFDFPLFILLNKLSCILFNK